jgi:membrane dipeptidase
MVGVNFAVDFLREDGKDEEDTPIETVVRHVGYLVERIGVERVGLGLRRGEVPREIGDACGFPTLLAALRERSYDEAALKKRAHENWGSLLGATWRR